MNSFLTKIDEHIRKAGIPFREFEISYTYLPKYIDYAITNMIREMKPSVYEIAGAENYIIGYDKDDNIYLKAVANDGRTTVIIYTEYGYSNYDHKNVIGRKVSESDLYNRACILKMRKTLQIKISEFIEKEFPNISKLDKIKKQYEIMEKINDEDLLLFQDLKDEEIDKQLEDAAKKTNAYINYINECYEQDIIAYLSNKQVDISYENPTPEPTKRKKGQGSTKERVNGIIPKNERLMILGNYSPTYFGIARSSNNTLANYYCFLYLDYNNKPVVVLESESGTNYTKVAFPKEKIATEEEFAEFCRKCLELSNTESLNVGNIIRFKHISIEEFKSNVELVINGVQEEKKYQPDKIARLKKIKSE